MDYQFEVFTRERKPRVLDGMHIRVNGDGTLTISRAAYNALGTPDFVELLYTPDKQTIGIRPVDGKTREAYTCHRSVNARSFFTHLGWMPVKPSLCLVAEMHDGILVATHSPAAQEA